MVWTRDVDVFLVGGENKYTPCILTYLRKITARDKKHFYFVVRQVMAHIQNYWVI